MPQLLECLRWISKNVFVRSKKFAKITQNWVFQKQIGNGLFAWSGIIKFLIKQFKRPTFKLAAVYIPLTHLRAEPLAPTWNNQIWDPDFLALKMFANILEIISLASTWIKKKAWLPCWPPRGQQMLHQRWIWGIHCTQALKLWADITISLKRGYQWSHKKTDLLPKNFEKK